jgi:hypothetical protein
MRYRIAALTLGFAALTAACTTASGTPATAPSVPETLATTTTQLPTTVFVVVTTEITTTTVDRLSEIQAIYEDLEHRRLQAIYDQDEDAFRTLYANDEYLERSMQVYDTIRVLHIPSHVKQNVMETLADTDTCIAALIGFDTREVFEGGGIGESIHVIEKKPDGHWGLSWVGTGWICDGPHPFS